MEPMNTAVLPMAQKIAQAVALGAVAAPTDADGWQSLVNEFQTTGGPVPGTTPPGISAQSDTGPAGTAAGGTSDTTGATGDVNSFLGAIKQHESGGNYTANNAAGGASGAYQFIQSTWSSEAKAAGYSEYAGGPASAAPPNVQDAVAAHMANSYYQEYGNWADAAEAWYDPSLVGKNVVPDPQAGNKETVSSYGQQIVDLMGQQSGSPSNANAEPAANAAGTSAVSWASQQIGTRYVWGGEAVGVGFDCSGLVQAAYKAEGIDLPRVAQDQYNATTKLPTNATLEPGDLVFFGKSTKDITHVGIYIGGGKMVDAPHTGADVRTESYQWADYVGATRPTDPTGQSMLQPASTAVSDPNPSAVPTREMNLGQYYEALNQVTSALAQHGATIGA